jgi:hypothetical protein
MHTYSWLLTRGIRPFVAATIIVRTIDAHFEPYRQRYKSFVQTFYSKIDWPSQSLLRYLEYAKRLRLSDPRDRIYAFMEQLQDSVSRVTIHPDYDASHLEVYRQFAVQYIQNTMSVHILNHVAHETGTGTADFNMPSWVPRWDIQNHPIASMPSNEVTLRSRDESVCKPTVINDASLEVRGVVMDTVQYMSNMFDDTLTRDTISGLWKAVSIMTEISPYDAYRRLDAFLSTLCWGRYFGE